MWNVKNNGQEATRMVGANQGERDGNDDIGLERRLELFRLQVEIRDCEKRAHDLFLQNMVKGTSHLSIGQEGVAAGFAVAMRKGDKSFCTYRGHAHTLARGASMEGMLGELMLRDIGLMRGKGGSMHLTSVEHDVLGSYAIVGAHLPIACGSAWRAQYLGESDVSVVFFGDGTTNIGAFHEALNLAAVWKLPVVFVCENNLYMEYTPIGDVTAVKHPAADRAGSYGLDRIVIDGNDADVVFRTAQRALERARAGEGPSLIECLTYRQSGHSRADPAQYRPAGELEEWMKRDPIIVYRQRLRDFGVADQTIEAIEAESKRKVDAATGSVQGLPARSRRTDDDGRLRRRRMGVAELTYRDAVIRAIAQEMERDNRVVFLGEDVAKAGGVFKATLGLYERFGPLRVRDTPISEQAILGAAMGAAMTGLRPIAEIMFADFVAVCFDYVANQMSKLRYMSNGQLSCPLVIRTGNGGGVRFGAQHSQSVENWTMMIPGINVVAPSSPIDVIGLMAAAVRDPDPVIFHEHKALYATKGEAPEGEIVDTLGTAKILRSGRDCTIIALALMVPRALEAAETLAGEHGVDAEVIDVRSLVPLDTRTILGSVAKTGRLFTVEENPRLCGWGAEIVSIVADEAFWDLDGPIVRITTPHIPLPAADHLEDLALPSAARIVDKISRVLNG
jgi:pyruvate/2-oxoglutarate/acetoin dehydrogenase E1 component/TPP-dependent pyruvate/acetoin dehydrogenase alpha subunit